MPLPAHLRQTVPSGRSRSRPGAALLGAVCSALAFSVQAQTGLTPRSAVKPTSAWQACTTLSEPTQRLACFDHWAAQQAMPTTGATATTIRITAGSAPASAPPTNAPTAERPIDCRDGRLSLLSRYWELEAGSDCGRFNIRGYRPISLSVVGSDSVNTAPSSPTAGHTATEQPYLTGEGRIQLSVRTKIGQGLLTHNDPLKRDSLWFGYTQQSYWQIFTPGLSRPFRNTDHEPELMYIVPTDAQLPAGWRLRYSGISLNHQSNGQSLPLSRSWNRVILMGGMELDERFTVTGRAWYRLPEAADSDDNPGIADYVGRAELSGNWQMDPRNTLGLTVRHALMATANGSWRLDWLRAIGSPGGDRVSRGLRFHVQLFSGYGDSLLDYNRQRTVLSVGLSLVDW